MKTRNLIFGFLLLSLITGCDAVSTYQGNEIAATKKMLGKVEKVKAELRIYSDSMLYRESRRIVDSIRLTGSKN